MLHGKMNLLVFVLLYGSAAESSEWQNLLNFFRITSRISFQITLLISYIVYCFTLLEKVLYLVFCHRNLVVNKTLDLHIVILFLFLFLFSLIINIKICFKIFKTALGAAKDELFSTVYIKKLNKFVFICFSQWIIE